MPPASRPPAPAVAGPGTAVRGGAPRYALRFLGGSRTLSASAARSVRAIGPGCVEHLTQAGSFTFAFSPAARRGFSFGGRGDFRSARVAVLWGRPGGGCRIGGAPCFRRRTLDADATQVFGVG